MEMYCEKCDKEIPEMEETFCDECEKMICPDCDSGLLGIATYCNECAEKKAFSGEL